jgi:hypothetical protein
MAHSWAMYSAGTNWCIHILISNTIKKNSMIWVRERTIPTERPPLVGGVITNFCE